MATYRMKPVRVEATRWFRPGDHPAVRRAHSLELKYCVESNRGPIPVQAGYYILTFEEDGNVIALPPDVFESGYELVEADEVGAGGWGLIYEVENQQYNDPADAVVNAFAQSLELERPIVITSVFDNAPEAFKHGGELALRKFLESPHELVLHRISIFAENLGYES